MADRSSLIAQLEKAEGPDRELDGDIWRYAMSSETRGVKFGPVPHLTSSIDAAVSLAERVLPGWTIASVGQDDRKAWHAELREGYRTAYSTVSLAGAPNGALALVLATLRALQQKGSSNG